MSGKTNKRIKYLTWTIKFGFLPLILQIVLDSGVVISIKQDVQIGGHVDCNDFFFYNEIANHAVWAFYEILFYLGF